MISRVIYKKIKNDLFKGKAIILVGPRQVGKTTLLQTLQTEYPGTLYLDCDEPDIRRLVEICDLSPAIIQQESPE